MSIKTFISEFQDNLFNFEPLFDRLDITRASKTDYYGAHKNAEDILELYKDSLEFIETNATGVDKEIQSIINGLNNKLDKIETFASTIIGINSSQDSFKELLTIHPYVLSEVVNWETIQKCTLLPILSTYRTIKPYGEILKDGKGIARFIIGDEYSTKYITIQKPSTTQLVSISYLNDEKEQLSSTSLPNTLNKTDIILEIPISTRYITIDYYYESTDPISIVPLSFKHQVTDVVPIGKKTYEYGNLLVFNSNVDLPAGCYAILDLNLSFTDVNNREVLNKQVQLSLDSDGVLVDLYQNLKETDTVVGYWLNNIYNDTDFSNIPDNAMVLFRKEKDNIIDVFTESALKFDVKNAKNIVVTASLKLYSLKSNTQTPRVFYLTGMTKNV